MNIQKDDLLKKFESVNVREFKNLLRDYLDYIEQTGESLMITRRNSIFILKILPKNENNT